MIITQNNFRMGYIGADRLWDSGALAPAPKSGTIRSLVADTFVTLDCRVSNDFAISTLGFDVIVLWENVQIGNFGTLIVRQDASGGHGVGFGPPSGYLLYADTPVLAPAQGANAFTFYTWRFTGVFPQGILLMSKSMPAPAT